MIKIHSSKLQLLLHQTNRYWEREELQLCVKMETEVSSLVGICDILQLLAMEYFAIRYYDSSAFIA